MIFFPEIKAENLCWRWRLSLTSHSRCHGLNC